MRTVNAAMEALKATMDAMPVREGTYFPPPSVMRRQLNASYDKLGGERIIKQMVPGETPDGAAHTVLMTLSTSFFDIERPEMSNWCKAAAKELLDRMLRR